MYRFDVIYKDYSACGDDFSRGINYLQQRSLGRAMDCFQRAYEAAGEQHPFRYMYLCYYGYARILSGDFNSIELCRHAAHKMNADADVHYILARAEMFCKNRLRAVRAIEHGIHLEPHHEGLGFMKKKLGFRQFRPLPFLPRNNVLNRSIGKLLRKKR